MRLFPCVSLGKLCGNGSKTNTNKTISLEAGVSDDPPRSEKTHFDDPTQSGETHFEGSTRTDKTHFEGPTRSDKTHFEGLTRLHKTHLDDSTPSDQAHFDHPTPSNKAQFDDPTPSDKAHFDDPTKEQFDDPTLSDQAHFDDPTPSDKAQLDDPPTSNKAQYDDPTPSDKAHFDDLTPSYKAQFDDPTPSDKAHFDDPTRNLRSAPLEIPLKEIEAITNNFADDKIIGEGFLGKIYEGELLSSGKLIDVSVRRLDNSFRLQELAFEKEISVLSHLKHENMVSIVGFCYENNEMLIINERVSRGSLSFRLNDPELTWKRRLQISVGAVSALSNLHTNGILHRNINSNTILLDKNWQAKLSGFEYSLRIPAGKLDLAYEKLGIGTYTSDVFSIGIVLFELLCGREAFLSKDNESFQASLAIFHYKDGKLHELVDKKLFSQMDQLSFKIFSETAYNCLNNQRPPTMIEVLKRLERALKVQQRRDNGQSTVAVERTIPEHLKLKLKGLEHMRIPLADIESATANFSKGCIVSTGGYGSVYTAELNHVDKAHCKTLERENEHEIPKKRNTVAIKLILDTEDEIAEEGFYAEVEMLTSCRHSNIITLLGFCDEGGKLILIYEYASNRSLSDYIQKTSDIHNDSWAQRVKICLDVAKGLSFLHTIEGERQEIVHRDIKSSNILLDEKFEAKIGDFGLSIFLSASKSTLYTRTIAGTRGYVDPQYWEDGKLKKESDVYSFGVILFEILYGTVAYFSKYSNNDYKGLALLAKQHFEKKTTKEMVDRKIKDEITETLFTSIKGPNQESLDTFSKIAYQCLSEAQVERPTMEVVVKELEKALFFQETRKDIYQVSLKQVLLATDNFNDENYIDGDGFWQAYRGEVSRANGNTTSIVVNRISPGYAVDTELKVLIEHKHENVIGLLGYCEEGEERVIVYEHAPNGSLTDCVNKGSLTWAERLKICIDIARGLQFLHGGFVTEEVVIHRDIESGNILLDADMRAKIAYFGFSIIHSIDQETVPQDYVSGTHYYMEPEYRRTGLVSKECDIYSFGIVLFEILLQRWAYSFGLEKEDKHLGPFMKDLYKKGKLDDVMFEGTNELIAPQSLTIFKRIAIQCLRDNRKERPTASEVLIQLKQALDIQEKGMIGVRISLEDIKCATDNFSEANYIGGGGFGNVFRGQLPHGHGQKIIAAKRLDMSKGQGEKEFIQELEILLKFKHRNVIGLEGYCAEMDERIIVYEYASNGSLDMWLDKSSLTWMQRLAICIGIANGLEFLHGGVLRQEAVIHRDTNSSNIVLNGDWEAKITDFRLSLISPNNQEIWEIPSGTHGYVDPSYVRTSIVSKASDMYTFGVVLFEILSGRLAYQRDANNGQYLVPLAINYHEQKKLDDLVFEGIKKQIVPQSLSTFANIAYSCLHDDPSQRPTANDVAVELKKALEFHVDFEEWGPKLPSDYKEIIQQTRTPQIYNTKKKKDIYDELCEGILIQKGKVWFSLDSNNKRNEMISATLFTYRNQSSQKWRHYRKSRFQRVPLMTNISNLKIQAKIKAQFLTPSVIYGVYLVFKFVEPNKISSDPTYVNLKYKLKNKRTHISSYPLHAYFATWRKDKWMMVEFYRFLNHMDDGDFEVLLESFSRCYGGSGVIYVEGIEFRAIDNVTHEEIEKSKDVQQIMRSNSNMSQMQQNAADNNEKFESSEKSKGSKPSEINGKKHHMLSAKEVLYNSSEVKHFELKSSEQSRFGEVIKVLSQQVVRIKCKIENQVLSSDTDYRCYLIFKLSKKCRDLHCPVRVRGVHRPVKVEGLPQQSNKETKAIYFRTPDDWNIHYINQIPKQREDGWMEVNVWKFNSTSQLRKDCIHLNFKLISYEGTMSGLVVCGLEFRPV